MAASQKTFGEVLKAHLKKRYDNELPQANMLARLYNMRSDEKDAITEEMMEDWLDSKTEPTETQLKTLQAWLGL